MKKLLIAVSFSLSLLAQAHAAKLEEQEEVFNPDIARAGVLVPAIDDEMFEIGAYAGSMKLVSDSDNSITYGGRLSYHFNPRYFVEGTYGLLNLKTTIKVEGEPLSSTSGSSSYWNVSAGYNFVDGELFVTDNTVMPVQFYVLGGVGQTAIDLGSSVNLLTINLGIGFRVLVTDYIALRMDIQDHIYDPDEAAESGAIANADKFSQNNMAMSLGVSWFF